jgi:hypothetical protein
MNRIITSLLLVMYASTAFAQGVHIGDTSDTPHASSQLEVESTSRGFLPPRLTTAERDAISSPAEGLMIYNTDSKCYNYFDGTFWLDWCGSCPAPDSPTAGVHVTAAETITWNWNAVSGATGYRYNTTNQYATASDLGNVTAFTQSGLTCGGASYSLYVWAYNACNGVSSALTLTAATEACPWTCGASTVSHGYVAGITPSANAQFTDRTYSTVLANAVWGGKCWTKMNLGSTAEATFADDQDAGRAGWRFQFNRLQGYYNPGPSGSTNHTPSANWTMGQINESSNWTSENDPCTQLLGGTWRIPTGSEWSAFYGTGTSFGGMANGTGSTVAYNSALKLHTAGRITPPNPSPGNTTLANTDYGYYWSSTQDGSTTGRRLLFGPSTGLFGPQGKTDAYSVRCVMD